MKCTCHPTEAPWPCAGRFAYSECKIVPWWRRVRYWWKTLFAVLLLMLVSQAAGAAPMTACQELHPGTERPKGWAYRMIENRQCWYQGRQMRPKNELFWPQPEPEFMRPGREEPEVTLPQEEAVAPKPPPWALEFRWPVYGKGE